MNLCTCAETVEEDGRVPQCAFAESQRGWALDVAQAVSLVGAVFLDATYYGASDAERAQAAREYAPMHVGGSAYVDIDALCGDKASKAPPRQGKKDGQKDAAPKAAADAHTMPTRTEMHAWLKRAFGRAAGPEQVFVCYDTTGVYSSPRLALTLRLAGFSRAYFLDGGLPAWRRGGLPLCRCGRLVCTAPGPAAGRHAPAVRVRLPPPSEWPGRAGIAPGGAAGTLAPTPAPAPEPVIGTPETARETPALPGAAFGAPGGSNEDPAVPTLVDGAGMRKVVGARTAVIVDCRSAARFNSEEPEPNPTVKRGRIPGSLNFPWKRLIAGTRLRPYNELQEVVEHFLRKNRLSLKHHFVFYCGSGITACTALAAFLAAGLPPSQAGLYDGSWAEYSTYV